MVGDASTENYSVSTKYELWTCSRAGDDIYRDKLQKLEKLSGEKVIDSKRGQQ
jgi:hypothetical protein